MGVEKNQSSFLSCIASLLSDYQQRHIKVSELRQIIASTITIDTIQKYHNGNLIKTFDTHDYTNIDLDKYKSYNTYNMLINGRERILRRIISGVEAFKDYLLDETNEIDYTYLWDILSTNTPELFPDGLNIIIMEDRDDDSTNKINIVCPSNAYSSNYFSMDKPSLILYKYNNKFEPLVMYRETKENKYINKLHLLNEDTLRPLYKFLISIKENQFKQCFPKQGSHKDFIFKMNIPASFIINVLRQLKIPVVKQILNFDMKVIYVVVDLEGKLCKVPTYPSSVYKDIPYELLSTQYNLDYASTYYALKTIYELSQHKIPVNLQSKF